MTIYNTNIIKSNNEEETSQELNVGDFFISNENNEIDNSIKLKKERQVINKDLYTELYNLNVFNSEQDLIENLGNLDLTLGYFDLINNLGNNFIIIPKTDEEIFILGEGVSDAGILLKYDLTTEDITTIEVLSSDISLLKKVYRMSMCFKNNDLYLYYSKGSTHYIRVFDTLLNEFKTEETQITDINENNELDFFHYNENTNTVNFKVEDFVVKTEDGINFETIDININKYTVALSYQHKLNRNGTENYFKGYYYFYRVSLNYKEIYKINENDFSFEIFLKYASVNKNDFTINNLKVNLNINNNILTVLDSYNKNLKQFQILYVDLNDKQNFKIIKKQLSEEASISESSTKLHCLDDFNYIITTNRDVFHCKDILSSDFEYKNKLTYFNLNNIYIHYTENENAYIFGSKSSKLAITEMTTETIEKPLILPMDLSEDDKYSFFIKTKKDEEEEE